MAPLDPETGVGVVGKRQSPWWAGLSRDRNNLGLDKGPVVVVGQDADVVGSALGQVPQGPLDLARLLPVL